MRLEMTTNQSQPLQNSKHNKMIMHTSEKSVEQEKNNELQKQDIIYSKEDMKNVIEGINQQIEPHKTGIQFKFHEELNEYYVTVVDRNTDEVIKEIPPEKFLDMHAAMLKFIGVLVDEKI